MRNVSGKICRGNQNTLLCSVTSPPPKNRVVYEIMWKNMLETDRPQMTIWRMRTVCWISKSIHTHTEYVIITAFLLQQWLHDRASVVRYTYIACIVEVLGNYRTIFSIPYKKVEEKYHFVLSEVTFSGKRIWTSFEFL